MVQVIVRSVDGSVKAIQCSNAVHHIQHSLQVPSNCYITVNGRVVGGDHVLRDYDSVAVLPRLCGGKGGFGSMLRAIGAQIEATTNNDACRDLSGKRLRDVKCEKMLKEWSEKQRDKGKEDRERVERKRQRLQKVLDGPSHIKSQDNTYISEMRSMSESIESAIAASSLQEDKPSRVKKVKKWYGDSDSSGEEEDTVTMVTHEEEDTVTMVTHEEEDTRTDSPPDSDTSPEPDTHTVTSVTSVTHAPPERERQKSEIKIRFIDDEGEEEGEGEETETDKAGVPPFTCTDKAGVPPFTCTPPSSSDSETADSTVSVPAQHVQTTPPTDTAAQAQQANPPTEQPTDTSVEAPQPTDTPNPPQTTSWQELDSVTELLALGGDVLKRCLADLGLKCGGTPLMRAERLFSVRNLSKEQIDPALFATAGKGRKRKGRS